MVWQIIMCRQFQQILVGNLGFKHLNLNKCVPFSNNPFKRTSILLSFVGVYPFLTPLFKKSAMENRHIQPQLNEDDFVLRFLMRKNRFRNKILGSYYFTFFFSS